MRSGCLPGGWLGRQEGREGGREGREGWREGREGGEGGREVRAGGRSSILPYPQTKLSDIGSNESSENALFLLLFPSNCCNTVIGVVKALVSLRGFIGQLGWPEEVFGNHLQQRFRSIWIDRFQEAADL